MTALLMTGFPGFLGSALLGRLLARRPGTEAICLVQDRHLDRVRERLAELETDEPHVAGRVRLVTGDLTAPGLGLSLADEAGGRRHDGHPAHHPIGRRREALTVRL